jgi:hypothetical protein
MPPPELRGPDDRFDCLAAIERLLDESRATRNRRLLRRAIELWDEEGQRLQTTTCRNRIH